MPRLLSLAAIYLAAIVTGYGFSLIGLPLPWMIGPLVAAGVLTASGTLNVRVPIKTRPFGQIVVATFVGGHFTPQAFHALLQTAPLLIAASLYILAASLVVGIIQNRLFGTDTVTGFLSVVPTSPVEAGVLAEGLGVPPAPVIFAQTVRIAIVVIVIPMLIYATSGVTPAELPAPQVAHTPLALMITLTGAIIGPLLFKVFRLTNPYFLGPLFVAAALSAWGLPAFNIPQPLLALAQIVLGTWLGSCFQRDLMKRSGNLLMSVLLTSGLLITLCILGAVGLAQLSDMPFAIVLLGIAPGGTTEMALTAGIIGQDVAMVTAMHLTRIFIIMPNLFWIARLANRANRKSKKNTPPNTT